MRFSAFPRLRNHLSFYALYARVSLGIRVGLNTGRINKVASFVLWLEQRWKCAGPKVRPARCALMVLKLSTKQSNQVVQLDARNVIISLFLRPSSRSTQCVIRNNRCFPPGFVAFAPILLVYGPRGLGIGDNNAHGRRRRHDVRVRDDQMDFAHCVCVCVCVCSTASTEIGASAKPAAKKCVRRGGTTSSSSSSTPTAAQRRRQKLSSLLPQPTAEASRSRPAGTSYTL